jgi:5'-phosphate synthase pdxT subunit
MVFIRAPYVLETYGGAEVLAVADEKIVAVKQGKILATAFHPELTDCIGIHELFVLGLQ